MGLRLVTPTKTQTDIEESELTTIYGNQNNVGPASASSNRYLEALRSYIPIELTGAYILFCNVSESFSTTLLIFVMVALTLLAPAYTYHRIMSEDTQIKSIPWWQCLCTAIFFIVWSYGIGGAWGYLNLHDSDFAFVITLVVTLILPLIGQDEHGRPVLYHFK
ncbi:hypothetical protein [Pseudoalteromonas byunsanensis]|uniref:Uncharacterized protein n=1 Tax=Pseudoalteromonas byunsanensis TaxID=327939 RepID=A0A1S1MYD9_9GAMM|nr:hypothetical protein [Pseudoalteromonas byunsanensis]OHU93940.1 hypothetical protein BIW53_17095 [Pseudoalteromonas byunsanensis]